MKKEELKIDQIIKFQNDTYNIVNLDCGNSYDSELAQGFNAKRLIKTRNTWCKHLHFLKFEFLERCEVI